VTLLKHYFEADEDPAVIREMARDWIEILAPYPQEAIAAACRTYLVDEPRKRPTPGAIRVLAIKAMDADPRLRPERLALARPVERERVRVTPEAAARILAEAGLTPRRLSAIANGRRMPLAGRLSHEDGETAPPPPATPEEIAARPYTEAEKARMRMLRGQAEVSA
jgi:hypothetical protein